ncbi:hypothetical protein [Pantoea sp. 18069]|uniref:hypothetical protein n=1 Tax=Pantoea sp. 18069 TaxID=2681415 RepID=UPI00190F6E28|nr:hypothetical protein [Pantoea sp. 18069]
MQPKISHLATILLGGVAALASASSMACSLVPENPARIKQLMANEIAHRLGMRPQQIQLSAITQPRLLTPFGLGADCSGLAAYHHTAGFRVSQPGRHGPGPGPWPGPGPDPGPRPWPGAGPEAGPRPGSGPWPGYGPLPAPGRQRQCTYEGVVVVLGYGQASPVAVNFERRCR